MNLSKPLKILLAGAVLAAPVAGGGGSVIKAVRLAKCKALSSTEYTAFGSDRAYCKEQILSEAEVIRHAPTVVEAQNRLQKFMAECDARVANASEWIKQEGTGLARLALCDMRPGIEAHGALFDAQLREASERRSLWLCSAAIAIAALSAAPWLWYFLLRRLAEVRQSVIGR